MFSNIYPVTAPFRGRPFWGDGIYHFFRVWGSQIPSAIAEEAIFHRKTTLSKKFQGYMKVTENHFTGDFLHLDEIPPRFEIRTDSSFQDREHVFSKLTFPLFLSSDWGVIS
jgi:hypothetical protein